MSSYFSVCQTFPNKYCYLASSGINCVFLITIETRFQQKLKCFDVSIFSSPLVRLELQFVLYLPANRYDGISLLLSGFLTLKIYIFVTLAHSFISRQALYCLNICRFKSEKHILKELLWSLSAWLFPTRLLLARSAFLLLICLSLASDPRLDSSLSPPLLWALARDQEVLMATADVCVCVKVAGSLQGPGEGLSTCVWCIDAVCSLLLLPFPTAGSTAVAMGGKRW